MSNNVHTHTFTSTVVPPTCTEKGYVLHKCDCGYEYKDNFTEAGAHAYEVVDETAPTCTEQGKRTVRCTRCGDVKVLTAPKLGHAWGNWSVQTAPTCTENGKNIRVCSRCGAIDEQIIEAKGHKFSKPQKSNQKGKAEYFCYNCGKTFISDNNTKKNLKIVLLGVLLPLILVAAIVISSTILSTNFLEKKTPGLRDELLYTVAQVQIARDKDTSAYFILSECLDYKDSREMLGKFEINFKNVEYDDGSRREYIFGNDGNVLSETYYYSDGSSRKYLYYEDGRLQSKAWYNDDGECTKLIKPTIEKDDKGRIVLEVWEDDGDVNKTEFIYTDDGKKEIETYYYSNSDVIDSKYETTYDKNDNVIAYIATYYDDYGNLQEKREQTYKYDDKGNVVSGLEISYNAQGGTNYKEEMVCNYDDNGNPTTGSVIYYGADGSVYGEAEFKWTYNDKGGCVNVARTVTTPGEEDENYEVKITLDQYNNPLEEVYIDNGEVTGKVISKYDEYGNKTLYEEYAWDDLRYKYEYDYDYDKKSLKETYKSYDENGDLEYSSVTEKSGMVAFYKPDQKEYIYNLF